MAIFPGVRAEPAGRALVSKWENGDANQPALELADNDSNPTDAVRKRHRSYSRRTVRMSSSRPRGLGVRQNIFAADFVVEGVEPIAGFCLRFRVQRRLQFLNAVRS